MKIARDLSRLAAARLGHCSRCMRTAFIVALSALVTLGVATGFRAIPGLTMLAGMAALGFTGLWLAHLAAYAVRRVNTVSRAMHGARGAEWGEHAGVSRRMALSFFLRSFAFAAAATSLPSVVSARLFLAYTCDCPPDFPQCVVNDSRNQETLCCGEDANGCTSEKRTWCCDKGHYCADDDGGCT